MVGFVNFLDLRTVWHLGMSNAVKIIDYVEIAPSAIMPDGNKRISATHLFGISRQQRKRLFGIVMVWTKCQTVTNSPGKSNWIREIRKHLVL